MASNRQYRVAERIQQEMAMKLQFEVSDPRLQGITISEVRVARDFSFADIYYTIMPDEGEMLSDTLKKEVASGLERAKGFFRSSLAKSLSMRVTPHLRFHFDEVTMKGNALTSLIHQAVKEDRDRQQGRDDERDTE